MAHRSRVKLAWLPRWDGEILGWTKKHIAHYQWRYDSLHSFDDLLQDNWIIFNKICDKYPRVVDQKHFMGLYTRAVINKMNDRSLYVKRKREVHEETSVDVSELYTGRIGELTNGGYASALLNEAPEELKVALAFIQANPEALRGRRKGMPRENLNMRLRRLLDWDTPYDFAGVLRNLLQP